MRGHRSDMRTVDALTGQRAPSRFFQALSEADHHCERDSRIAALEAENRSLRAQLAAFRGAGDAR